MAQLDALVGVDRRVSTPTSNGEPTPRRVERGTVDDLMALAAMRG